MLATGSTATPSNGFPSSADSSPSASDPLAQALKLKSKGYPEKAFRALEPLLHLPLAQFHVGMAYLTGEGVGRNFVQAFSYLTLATNAGIPEAEFHLGMMYLKNQIIPFNYDQGLTHIVNAANLGLPQAHYYLGFRFLDASNFDEAKAHFEAAALGGMPDGYFQLAIMYLMGQGAPVSHDDANLMFAQALHLHRDENTPSFLDPYHLGFMYENGYGVTQDIGLAIKEYHLAGCNGSAMGFLRMAMLSEQKAGDSVYDLKTVSGWYESALSTKNRHQLNESDKEFIHARISLINWRLGCAYFKDGEFGQAERFLRVAAQHPEFEEQANNLLSIAKELRPTDHLIANGEFDNAEAFLLANRSDHPLSERARQLLIGLTNLREAKDYLDNKQFNHVEHCLKLAAQEPLLGQETYRLQGIFWTERNKTTHQNGAMPTPPMRH